MEGNVHKPAKIYALIDFSEYAPVLVRYAFALSQAWQCRVVFLHQVGGAVPALADEESKRQILLHEQQGAILQLKTLVSSEVLFINASYEVISTDLVQWLLHMDHQSHENWVLTGLKGTGLLKQLFLGSTTNQIIEHTDLPVIALPLLQQVHTPQKVALGLYYKHPINLPVCAQMLERLGKGMEEITFFTIITDMAEADAATEYLYRTAEALPEYTITAKVYKGEHPFEEIKNMMLQLPDTVLMLQQGSRSLTDMFFRRFMINELVYHGKIPLLIIPK
jgi:hypothetical protein